MKTAYKIIACFFSMVLFAQAKSTYAMQIDLTADVIGTARDKQYDGVFEELINNVTTNNFETFGVGRVVDGAFVAESRSILEFDLTSINSTTNIRSVTLTMEWASRSNLVGAIDFYGYEGNGILDINDATNTGTFVASGSPATNPVSFDVTEYIQSHLDKNISWAGFLGIETLDGAVTSFWANYNDSYAQVCGPHSPPTCVDGEIIYISSQPTLSVVYAPVPGAAILFTSGLFGLIGFTRHHRKKEIYHGQSGTDV